MSKPFSVTNEWLSTSPYTDGPYFSPKQFCKYFIFAVNGFNLFALYFAVLCFSRLLNDLLQLAYNSLFLCLLSISSHFACLDFLRHFRVSLLAALCSASNLLLLFGPLLILHFIHAAASRSPLLSQFTASSTEKLNKSLACVMTFWSISSLTASAKWGFFVIVLN